MKLRQGLFEYLLTFGNGKKVYAAYFDLNQTGQIK